ncbi:MAG: TonB-dependent receptor [Bacteroidota bacterium]
MKHIFIFMALLVPTLLIGQVDLRLSVSNADDGQAVANVQVILQNEGLGLEITETTNAQGLVIFKGLPVAGNYQAVISEDDTYYKGIAAGIVLRSNQPASASISLLPKASFELDEIIIGSNSATSINAVNAEVSASLSREEMEVLPLEGRDITRVLYRLPNVTQATGFYPEAPNVAINGANSLFTNYMIDGMDNNERFLGGQKFRMPVGFTQDVTVLNSNFSVEFGNTNNGAINLTSRSGSNTTTGEVFFVTRPGAVIDAPSEFAQRDLSGNQVKDGFQRFQGGFALGGALKKDKTFYYINAEQIVDVKDNLLNVPQLGINETVRGVNRFTLLSGKIDQIWSDKFRTAIRINGGLVNIDRQGGGLEGGVAFPSAGNSQDRNSLLIAAKNTYVGSNFTSETNYQYSRFRWNYGRADNPDDPQVTVIGPDAMTIAVLGHPGYVFDSRENTQQIQQKFTFYQGNHTIKAGAELISADHQLFGGGNPNGNYTVVLNEEGLQGIQDKNLGSALGVQDLVSVNPLVTSYTVELRPSSFGKVQNIFSIYAEDQWAATSRLNLNLGFRYDYDNLSRGGASRGDVDNIAPRFSFNYQLPNRASIRGGAGIFYDKIMYAIYSDALQQNTTASDYRKQVQALIDAGKLPADTDLDAVLFDGNIGATIDTVGGNTIPYLGGPSSAELQANREGVFFGDRRILSPFGYDNPYTQQFTLGYQQEIGKNMLVYVDLMHNRSFNLFRINNLNAAALYPINDPNNVVPRSQAEADADRVIPITNNTATINGEVLTGVARNVIITESAGRSRYSAATINIQKNRGDDKYAYRVNYTLSKFENDTEGINFRAMDGNDYESEWGPSINDRRHVINGYVTWFPVKGLAFSLASIIQSGQPINWIPNLDEIDFGGATPTTDLNGDGRSFGDSYVGNSDRYPGESRNSGRLPWSYTFDLGAEYNFVVAGNKFRLRADVFNVLNTVNYSGYANNARQSNQIQTGPATSNIVFRNAAPPRQFQFSINYLF